MTSAPTGSDWLALAGKTIAVFGVANRKSVGWHVGHALQAAGARVAWVVRSDARRTELAARLAPGGVHVCDVERPADIERVAGELAALAPLDGFVHSIAFANYAPDPATGAPRPFHATPRADFLQALDVSCYSLVALSNALRPHLSPQASVVALSISTTRMASESYGYMAPIKAALDASVVFLAKSFSAFSQVRFNAVAAGPLKTSSSAGIPGYLDAYLHAEACTLRRRGLSTQEVADAALFLLSPRSSGINASSLLVDAGMGVNYFDRDLIRRANRPETT
ncbi:MAG: SDR family oxidoreductase [Planctomycetes bacterium]|nr:SDR family oxidoreductase [Planctomycetota bacterium]